jgi:hypothetical protein
MIVIESLRQEYHNARLHMVLTQAMELKSAPPEKRIEMERRFELESRDLDRAFMQAENEYNRHRHLSLA